MYTRQVHLSPDVGNTHLKYAWLSGTTWYSITVDAGGYWGGAHGGTGTSLALDTDDHPHIAYYDDTDPNFNLKYAHYDGFTWQIKTVDDIQDSMVGEFASLALDSNGYPHISYYVAPTPNHALKYAHYNGSTWLTETVDSSDDARYDTGRYTSLALDETDHPHISYRSRYDLKYAWHDGAAWHIETVDAHGGGAWQTSLALDELGRPHIGYHDNFDLKYAYASTSPQSLGVELGPDHTRRVGAGQTITYHHTLTNTGTTTDTFLLEFLSTQHWPTDLLGGAYPTGTLVLPLQVGPQITASFQVSLIVPLGTAGVTETTIITATSQLSPTVQDTATDTTIVVIYRVYLPLVLRQ